MIIEYYYNSRQTCYQRLPIPTLVLYVLMYLASLSFVCLVRLFCRAGARTTTVWSAIHVPYVSGAVPHQGSILHPIDLNKAAFFVPSMEKVVAYPKTHMAQIIIRSAAYMTDQSYMQRHREIRGAGLVTVSITFPFPLVATRKSLS